MRSRLNVVAWSLAGLVVDTSFRMLYHLGEGRVSTAVGVLAEGLDDVPRVLRLRPMRDTRS